MHTSPFVSSLNPLSSTWRAFAVRYCALWGVILLGAGVICFIAWNWNGLTPITQLTLLGAGMILGWLAALRCGLDSVPGKLALLWSAILVGPLFAVHGQAYQSGAPLWNLFALWAACAVPLACVSRQTALWALAWGTGVIAVFLWLNLGRPEFTWLADLRPKTLIAAVYLIVPLLAWEAARFKLVKRGEAFAFLAPVWLSRLMVLPPLFLLTLALIDKIFTFTSSYYDDPQTTSYLGTFAFALYIVFAGALGFWARYKIKDLCMLTMLLFSLCALTLTLIGRQMDLDWESFFIMAFCVIGLLFGATKILLTLKKQMNPAKAEADTANLPTSVAEKNCPVYPLSETPPSPFEEKVKDEESHDLPWYIVLMQAMGAWLASLFFLGFLGLLLFESKGILPGGIIVVGLAAVTQRLTKPNSFLSHFTLPLALAGSIALWFGLYDSFGYFNIINFLYPLLLVLLFWAVPHTVFRVCVVSVGGAFAWFLFNDALHWQYHPVMSEDTLPVLTRPLELTFQTLIFGAGILYAAWLGLSSAGCIARQSNDLRPWQKSLFFGLCLFMVIGLSFGIFLVSNPAFVGIEELTAFWPFSFGMAASSGLLFAALVLTSPQKLSLRRLLPLLGVAVLPLLWRLHIAFAVAGVLLALLLVFVVARQEKQKTWPRLAIVALAASTGAAAFWMPALPMAVLGMVLAQAQKQRIFAGAAILYLAASLFQFYYALNTTLLSKSLVLLASGVVLALLAALLSESQSNIKTLAQQAAIPEATQIPRRQKLHSFTRLMVSSLIILGTFGCVLGSATKQEREISTAERFFLQLAPRDPRALLMGDYMELHKQVEIDAINSSYGQQDLLDPKRNKVILRLEPTTSGLPIADFVRFDDGTKLAPDERSVNFRVEGYNLITIGPTRFYFAEGAGQALEEKAYFGIFALSKDGRLWLIGLADIAGQPLDPEKLKR